jgi:cysteine desulfurase
MPNLKGYFDYAAATPIDERVNKAMDPYLTDLFYNPSAQYAPARQVNADLKSTRFNLAKLLGAKPTEIIFTSGATEANNMAIYGVMQNFPYGNVITSAIEHESVLKPAETYYHRICHVDKKGVIDLPYLESLIDNETILVSVMLANNEIGTLQPIKKVAEIIKGVRETRQKKGIKTPIYLHTDAAQATNYIDLHVSRLGIDLMSINGGKIYGPKQTGALFIKTGINLKPLILGGGQERGLRSGTENIADIVGFVKAVEIAHKMRQTEVERLSKIRDEFIKLLQQNVPNHQINGSLKNRLPNNLNVTFFGEDNERLMMMLDDKGFCVAVGSACSASSDEPSHVLKALGASKKDIQSSLRFSMGRFTTNEDVENLVKAIKHSVRA